MAYSDFTLDQVTERLGLSIEESADLFGVAPEVAPPPGLAATLTRYMPVALYLSTEKARSEFLIAPLLMEFKLQHRDRIALFSGIEFNVDEAAGLKGRCDYILSRNPQQLNLKAPICVVVEAKKEDIVNGVPQCLAEMVAAQRFNARAGDPQENTYGIVTSGTAWRFLKLQGTTAWVDAVEYSIHVLPKLIGVLTAVTLPA